MESQYEMLCKLPHPYVAGDMLTLFLDHQGTINLHAGGWNDYQDWDTFYNVLSREQAIELAIALFKAAFKNTGKQDD